MRALVQRVTESRVVVDGNVVGEIKQGVLVLIGIGKNDAEKDADWMAQKIINLRIFSDEAGKMNKSVKGINGDVLIVSQFTLYADAKKGNRPSFTESAAPDMAKKLYEYFISKCEEWLGKKVQTGIFAADMKVHLVNDGPVTIWIDSEK